MAKKSSVLRQERRQTGGGKVPKEAELTDFELRTSIPQYINFCFVDSPVTPSQNTDKITEYDSSSDPSNAVMDMNDLKPTPKIARPLKETLAMFRKRAKTPTAPSAAARAAACIEEHRMKIKYMEMDEERKNEEHQLRMEQWSNNMKMDEERKNEEHKLRMELLRIKIAHAKEKMEAQKILVTTLKGSPKIYLQNTE
ncbi:hypothetical protein TNCV_2436741 [Trichonephila clavipes]|nr:hypothetical protein TNCV_2436741 [Trichonephila clavipes]